ncbi:MAG: hypothetical protein BWX71_02574 [Deltaproteobacteria bacterium ADurb.Bin072]|nr:MAG: hypothetical protein BWX71_02574 [Deltaproteobacteria bacterium ADurb.Bin072]
MQNEALPERKVDHEKHEGNPAWPHSGRARRLAAPAAYGGPQRRDAGYIPRAPKVHRLSRSHRQVLRGGGHPGKAHRRCHQGDDVHPRSPLHLPLKGRLQGDADQHHRVLRRSRHRARAEGQPAHRDHAHRGHPGLQGRHPARRQDSQDRLDRHDGHVPGRGGQAPAGAQGLQGHAHHRP